MSEIRKDQNEKMEMISGIHQQGLNREGYVTREGNQGEESDCVENSSKSCRTAHLEQFRVKSRTATKIHPSTGIE
jgi:hypothetical protein